MATDSAVAITAGSGTDIHTIVLASGDHEQIFQNAWATAESDVFWPASQTASTSVVTADIGRVGMTIVNRTTGRVYLRWDTTAPTTASNGSHWFLEADDRYEVPFWNRKSVVSIIGSTASGHVQFHLSTAA